jgi:hypothetical protein
MRRTPSRPGHLRRPVLAVASPGHLPLTGAFGARGGSEARGQNLPPWSGCLGRSNDSGCVLFIDGVRQHIQGEERSISHHLQEGTDWFEVVHPTRTQPLHTLHITVQDRSALPRL